jgi:hypothetical protein
MTKNFLPGILITGGMTFEFEYLGEFEFIFENNLELELGDQRWIHEHQYVENLQIFVKQHS